MCRRLNNATLALLLIAALMPSLGIEPFAPVPAAHAQAGLPALPDGWPTTLPLGRTDGPGGAAAMKAKAPFGFRYQYLSAGVNTGYGWQYWQGANEAPGMFVTRYVDESVAQGITPVFTYYMVYQSLPGGGGEQSAVLTNLNTTATMQAYWADLKLFFQKAGAFPNTPVVLHVEPDMWGYVQQVAGNDNAASVAAKVNATGVPEVAGLPDTVAGLAQGIVRMRNQYAPNVILGYQVSVWGTGVDIALSDPSDSQVDALGTRAGAFYTSLGASFDVAFGEFSDRDSAYMVMVQNKGPHSWWNEDDFRRHARFVSRFVATSGKRMVMWQIPLGNTKMRAMNNTTHHYQDNRVEWLLDEPARTHLTTYVNAGVIGFLFGGGNGDVTCACDAAGDGTTNPAAVNGNTTLSYTADDDGGFFHNRAAAYYAAGAMSLPAGTAQPTTPTPTPGTPTTTPVPPVVAPGAYVTSMTAAPASVSPGGSTTLTAAVTSGSAGTVLVDVEVYSPSMTRVHQQWFDSQAFTAGQQRFFPVTWNVPGGAATGTYTVMIGVFSPGWGTNHAWNAGAGTIGVTTSSTPTPTPTPPTATPTPPPVACSPRPPVQVTTTPAGGGLGVNVAATGQDNRLLALEIGQTNNALVDIGGQIGRTGTFTVSLPGTSASTSFTLRRKDPGPATVNLTVVDRCGGWTTFVGGGANAF